MELILGFLYRITIGRLLNVRPKIRKERGCLIAHSAWLFCIFTLGMRYRRVTVDPNQRIIRIYARSLWFFKKVTIVGFDSIQWLVYEYKDVSPLGGIPTTTYQEQDLFIVSVVKKNRQQVILARFYGQGDFANNTIFPDWFYWEEIGLSRLSQGNQEDESRMYASTVAAIIGVEIRNDLNYLY